MPESAIPPAWLAAVPANSMRQCLPLMALLASDAAGTLRMNLNEGCVLELDVEAVSAHD